MFPWLEFSVGAALLSDALDLVLDFRQLNRYERKTVPKELASVISDEDFKKSAAYNSDVMKFDIVSGLFDTAVSLYVTLKFVYPAVYGWAMQLLPGWNEYVHSLVFIGVTSLVSTLIGIPFALYKDFVIEKKHGFNKKTLRIFVTDLLKTIALGAVIGAPVTCVAIFLVHWAGPHCYIYLWAFSVVFSLVMMWVYPVLIAPLFNKYEALKDEELKQKVEKLALTVDYPLKKLYQVDGSIRSSHSNAYMYGFWKNKRIVLYDTLLKIPHEQIIAILGHELGHWKKSHALKGMLVGFVQLYVMLYLFKCLVYTDDAYESFGFGEMRPVIAGMLIFSQVQAPIGVVLGLLANMWSRRHEYQADAFAKELGYGDDLARGLISIFKDNKGTYDPDEWYEWVHYSHPSLIARLKALRTHIFDRNVVAEDQVPLKSTEMGGTAEPEAAAAAAKKSRDSGAYQRRRED